MVEKDLKNSPSKPPSSVVCGESSVVDYLNGELNLTVERAFENHLGECVECRGLLEQLAAEKGFWTDIRECLHGSPQSSENSCDYRGLADSVRWLLYDQTLPVFASTEDSGEFGWHQWMEPPLNERSIGRVHHYEILSIIGRGGMGVVFLAMDTELNRLVALKTLSPEVRFHEEARLRLFREARAIALLNHPNIISIYAFESWAGVPFIVVPYIEGGNLQDYVDKQELSIIERLEIAIQISDALSALHRAGVVHRDLKPSNVLVHRESGQILLSDFGLAIVTADPRITRGNAIAGTPHFMSPEQANGQEIDYRSDLFSLGSLIYWLLTKQLPFADRTNLGVLRKIVEQAATPMITGGDLRLNPVQHIVTSLLEKVPARRIESASVVAENLREYVRKLQERDLEPLVSPEPTRSANHKLTKLFALFCVLLVATATLGAWNRWANQSAQRNALEMADASQAVTASPFEAVTEIELENSVETFDSIPFEDLGLPLSNQERMEIVEDLKNNRRTKRWLTRLSKMPIRLIPEDVLGVVQRLEDHEKPEIRELVDVIMNKNPFELVDDTDVFGIHSDQPHKQSHLNTPSDSPNKTTNTLDPFSPSLNPFLEDSDDPIRKPQGKL